MYKLSIYNIYKEDGEFVFIYNTLHRSFLAVANHVMKSIEDTAWGKISTESKVRLQKYGLLLPTEIDEQSVFRDATNKVIFQRESIGIFLSMTARCNLNCHYCYQDYRKENEDNLFQTEENIDTLVEFIKSSGVKNLSIAYFGGEPTLDQDVLIYAINQIDAIPDIIVHHTLITNGSMITPQLGAVIQQIDGFTVQITFDGNQAMHDAVRVTEDGEPTYDIIMQAIEMLQERVIIRINVSSTEFAPYKQLLNDIKQRFGVKNTIGLAAVFDGQKKVNCPEVRHNGDIIDLQDYAVSLGFKVNESIEYAPCMAHDRASFAIDEKLNVYLCAGTLYEKPVGKLSKSDNYLSIENNQWYQMAFDIPTCVTKCVYGGLCYGGCVTNRQCRKSELDILAPRFMEQKISKFYQGRKTCD